MTSHRGFLVAGTLAIALVGGGISAAGASPARAGEGVHQVKYDGEDLFRGVVFGQGPAGDVLGDLTADVQITSELEHEIDRVVSDIEGEDARFFDEFAEKAQSGDVVQVEEAFADLGGALDRALDNLGYDDGSAELTVTPRCIQVVLFAVGAVVYAGAAILQVAAVAVSVWYAGPRSANAAPPLSHEKWIAEATVQLAAP